MTELRGDPTPGGRVGGDVLPKMPPHYGKGNGSGEKPEASERKSISKKRALPPKKTTTRLPQEKQEGGE